VIDTVHRSFAVAVTLFALMSAATNVGVARIYRDGVAELRAHPLVGERDVRVLARPLRLKVGQHFSRARLEAHLDALGYYALATRDRGCYNVTPDALTIWARYAELSDVTVRWNGDDIASLTAPTGEPLQEATVEPETIATFMNDAAGSISRTHIEPVPFAALDGSPLADAVVASEDGLFRTHHGVDFMRLAAVPIAGGGASTITMQVARLNVLEDRRRTLTRKASEIGVAMAIERTYSKDAILTAYMNTVDLGASRGRPVHGFGAAAREYFGIRDLRQATPIQAATLAALLNQPSRYLDELQDGDDTRLQRQRNRVLRLMRKHFPARYSDAWLRDAEQQPVTLADRSSRDDVLGKISRHALDYALTGLEIESPARVYLTLDAALQQIAVEAVERGALALEQRAGMQRPARVQAALLAIDPSTGEILAMVGSRDYETSQFNRSMRARRQIGSIMKPFTYLAAFERAAQERVSGISPATLVLDRPETFVFRGIVPWRPANYDNNYAGTITWQRALAESRNVPAVKVAAWAGFARVAALWQSASGQSGVRVFPSIALGALQATPAEVATAYTVFANDGLAQPLRAVTRVIKDGERSDGAPSAPRRVATPHSAAVVRDMMRGVMENGTGRSARAAGFLHPAAGKTGTTDNLRDAWFVGFTHDLLTVVWVGRDDDRPLGFTGAQAALPIWTEFMTRALPADPRKTSREVADPRELRSASAAPASGDAPRAAATQPLSPAQAH
jgi:penicillin-binding protein 1B